MKRIILISLLLTSCAHLSSSQNSENIGKDAQGGIYSVNRTGIYRSGNIASIESRIHYNQPVQPENNGMAEYTDIVNSWRFDCSAHQYVLQRTVFYLHGRVVQHGIDDWFDQSMQDIPEGNTALRQIEQIACSAQK